MRKHRLAIGWMHLVFGALLAIGFVLSEMPGIAYVPVVSASVIGLLVLGDHRLSHYIYVPLAAIEVLAFPLGTLLGGYCLWYYFRCRAALRSSDYGEGNRINS